MTQISGGAPLCLAAELGHGAVVELLLEARAALDGCDEEGDTALHLAACAAAQATQVELLSSL